MPQTLADGQLAASAATILSGATVGAQRVTVILTNTGGSAETVVLSLSRDGGTARQLARAVLSQYERLIVTGLCVDPADVLKGQTSNATAVDYTILAGAGPDFRTDTYDANGALRSGSAAIGSGNLTISGDLTVSGGDIDAGASGAAGTVDIFPSTASKGKLALTAADSSGNTTTTVVNASQATTRTYTIPDALASADFLLGKQAAVARTATADGLTTGIIADSGRLQHITVTSADANHIIVLPTPTPGTIIVLHVGSNGFELRTSDPTTIAINGGTGSAAESAIAANSTVVMICVSATAWKGFFLDADSDLAKVEAAA